MASELTWHNSQNFQLLFHSWQILLLSCSFWFHFRPAQEPENKNPRWSKNSLVWLLLTYNRGICIFSVGARTWAELIYSVYCWFTQFTEQKFCYFESRQFYANFFSKKPRLIRWLKVWQILNLDPLQVWRETKTNSSVQRKNNKSGIKVENSETCVQHSSETFKIKQAG